MFGVGVDCFSGGSAGWVVGGVGVTGATAKRDGGHPKANPQKKRLEKGAVGEPGDSEDLKPPKTLKKPPRTVNDAVDFLGLPRQLERVHVGAQAGVEGDRSKVKGAGEGLQDLGEWGFWGRFPF